MYSSIALPGRAKPVNDSSPYAMSADGDDRIVAQAVRAGVGVVRVVDRHALRRAERVRIARVGPSIETDAEAPPFELKLFWVIVVPVDA